jgi:hypothetical protein
MDNGRSLVRDGQLARFATGCEHVQSDCEGCLWLRYCQWQERIGIGHRLGGFLPGAAGASGRRGCLTASSRLVWSTTH